jgi:hypothetical protein
MRRLLLLLSYRRKKKPDGSENEKTHCAINLYPIPMTALSERSKNPAKHRSQFETTPLPKAHSLQIDAEKPEVVVSQRKGSHQINKDCVIKATLTWWKKSTW